jgi:hypothetical protein
VAAASACLEVVDNENWAKWAKWSHGPGTGKLIGPRENEKENGITSWAALGNQAESILGHDEK